MALTDIIKATTDAIRSDPANASVPMQARHELVGVFEVKVRTASHEFTIDEPESIGGGNAGPNPVELTLAALGSCQAITYRLWSEKLGIPFDRIEIEVDGGLDVRGFFGVEDTVRPGLGKIRVNITIAGPQPPARYQALREAVDRHCPVLDMFKNTVQVNTELHQGTGSD